MPRPDQKQRKYSINLPAHMAECDANYLRLEKLFPGMREEDATAFGVDVDGLALTYNRLYIIVFALLVLFALFFLGGEIIHGFATALIIGVFIGTYSSIFVASPVCGSTR